MAVREIERFEAISDAGDQYIVLKVTQIVRFHPQSGVSQNLDGATAYQLLDGRHVNRKDAMTFEIFDTDEIIRKVG